MPYDKICIVDFILLNVAFIGYQVIYVFTEYRPASLRCGYNRAAVCAPASVVGIDQIQTMNFRSRHGPVLLTPTSSTCLYCMLGFGEQPTSTERALLSAQDAEGRPVDSPIPCVTVLALYPPMIIDWTKYNLVSLLGEMCPHRRDDSI
jgi:hypothetical protein